MASDLDPFTAYEDEPCIENGVHHPYSAFNQGWDAAEHGAGIERNPYDEGTREHHWWRLGWFDQSDDDTPALALPDPPSISLRRIKTVARTETAPTHGKDDHE